MGAGRGRTDRRRQRRARSHRDQEAICYLLAEKAREGKIVARLKWGDPFLFDSGGEEALFLHEQGMRFEVIPGVPLAIGASAHAGIPITYPGSGDTVTFVRGHEDEGREKARVDWASTGEPRRHRRRATPARNKCRR